MTDATMTGIAESVIVNLTLLPIPAYYPAWSRGRVLIGVTEPQALSIRTLTNLALSHTPRAGLHTYPTGHDILATLVNRYSGREKWTGLTVQVDPDDAIQGHFGLKELLWLRNYWMMLPDPFRWWVSEKYLFGYRDIIGDADGDLYSPYLDCHYDKVPLLEWRHLNHPLLYNQVCLAEHTVL